MFGDDIPNCLNSKGGILRQAPQSLNNNRSKLHPSGTAMRQVCCQLALHAHIQCMAMSGRSCIKDDILEGQDNMSIKSSQMATSLCMKEDISWS